LRGKTLAAFPHGVLALGPVPLIVPGLIVGLGAPCRQDLPRRLEVPPRGSEARRTAALLLTPVHSRGRTRNASPIGRR